MTEAVTKKDNTVNQTLVSSVLARVIPVHIKRMILFASLSAKMSGDKFKLNSSTLAKLNDVMALSKRDDALTLPVKLCKVIWRGDAGEIVLYPAKAGSSEEEEMVTRLLGLIPEWLKYPNRKALREDMVQLLRNQELIVSRKPA